MQWKSEVGLKSVLLWKLIPPTEKDLLQAVGVIVGICIGGGSLLVRGYPGIS